MNSANVYISSKKNSNGDSIFPSFNQAESDKIINKDADLPKFSLEKKEASQKSNNYKGTNTYLGTNPENTTALIKDFDFFIRENFKVVDFSSASIKTYDEIGGGGFSKVHIGVEFRTKFSAIALKSMIHDNDATQLNKIDDIGNYFVQFYNIYEDKTKKIFIISLEYGVGSLEEFIKKSGENPEEAQIINILSNLINGLALLHDNQLVHRDIKPANLIFFIYEDGNYKVKYGDFGLTIYWGSIHEMKEWVGGGTKYYFPPEVLAKMKEKNKIKYYYPYKFDVYCLGIVILQMMNLNKEEIKKIKKCKDLSLLNFPKLKKYKKLWPFVRTRSS